jgi:hypothetical protein
VSVEEVPGHRQTDRAPLGYAYDAIGTCP